MCVFCVCVFLTGCRQISQKIYAKYDKIWSGENYIFTRPSSERGRVKFLNQSGFLLVCLEEKGTNLSPGLLGLIFFEVNVPS